jgi:hypothetical protein
VEEREGAVEPLLDDAKALRCVVVHAFQFSRVRYCKD